jgi:hypothetical protein
MDSKNISEPQFQGLLSLLEDGYGKNKAVTEFVHRLAGLTKDKWTLVSLKAVGGGPSISLNVRTRNRVIKLSLDLAAKLNVLVFKKHRNEKNYKRRKRGQA